MSAQILTDLFGIDFGSIEMIVLKGFLLILLIIELFQYLRFKLKK
jgi:hypothetical protein